MELNTILIILGVAALIILIVHGIWSSRREQSRYFKSAETFTNDSRLQNRKTPESISTTENSAMLDSSSSILDDRQQSLSFEDVGETNLQNDQTEHIKIHLPQNEIHANKNKSDDISHISTLGELEKFKDEEYGIDTHSFKLREQLAELGRAGKQVIQEVSSEVYSTQSPHSEPISKPEFLMLYIVAPEGFVFQGSRITKILDELGFLFGDKEIYHRHADLSIDSPILFSIANMEQPGTFHYNMQDFSTVGLALFIQFPSEGNDLMNLRMMIRAAKSIAEDLNGFVLTSEQKIFDELEEKRYLDSIR